MTPISSCPYDDIALLRYKLLCIGYLCEVIVKEAVAAEIIPVLLSVKSAVADAEYICHIFADKVNALNACTAVHVKALAVALFKEIIYICVGGSSCCISCNAVHT